MVGPLSNLKLDAVLGPMALPKLDEEKLKRASLRKELILRRADLFARAVIRSLRILMVMAAVVGWVKNYETALKIYIAIIGFIAILLFFLGLWASPGRLAHKDFGARIDAEETNEHEDQQVVE